MDFIKFLMFISNWLGQLEAKQDAERAGEMLLIPQLKKPSLGSTPCTAGNAPWTQPTDKPQHGGYHGLWTQITQDGGQHMVLESLTRDDSCHMASETLVQDDRVQQAAHGRRDAVPNKWRQWPKSSLHWHPGLQPVGPPDPGNIAAPETKKEAGSTATNAQSCRLLHAAMFTVMTRETWEAPRQPVP